VSDTRLTTSSTIQLRGTSPRSYLPSAAIIGLGEYRPNTSITNAAVVQRWGLTVTDDWIRSRTGIISRRIASEHESVAYMAAGAAGKALATAQVSATAVDLVIVATASQSRRVPGAAAEVADMIAATNAGALDVNGACAGFCYGLSFANDLVRGGTASYVLVVGAERMSDWLDGADMNTSILFGDGAGAALVGPAAQPGIGPVVWGSDGTAKELITIAAGSNALRMDGRAVYRWATTNIPPLALRACDAAGVSVADLSAFVPHQANLRIVDALTRALRLPSHVVVADDIVEMGNTSAASVPLALTRLVAAGAVSTGGLALLVGFGAGLTYAGQVVSIP